MLSRHCAQGPGQILHAVPRESVGEFWFLLGVLVIYVIARDDVVVYSIGILVLAVADMAAALVGLFYGQHSFAVSGGTKSAEGSSALLLTAFLCVHVPILLFTECGAPGIPADCDQCWFAADVRRGRCCARIGQLYCRCWSSYCSMHFLKCRR